jgi:hypothetical protein
MVVGVVPDLHHAMVSFHLVVFFDGRRGFFFFLFLTDGHSPSQSVA